MKIIFWGTPKYSSEHLINIVKAGYEVTAVITQPDRKRSRGKNLSPSPVKKTALEFNIPVYTTQSISKDQNIINLLIKLNADVYVVVAFGQILPREILDLPKHGCWNSHASLLPVWRGAAPIQWSIINDDSKTGVCIMAMEEGLDTGPVIKQESTIISDADNLELLTNRLSNISSKLLIQCLENIKLTEGLNKQARLKKLNAIDQIELEGKPSYARQIKKEDYLIDWSQNARNIIKKIQGLYPNAFTFYNGKRIKILEANILRNKEKILIHKDINENSEQKNIPGEIIMINKEVCIIIMTNDFPIQIKIAQLEGKNITDGFTLSNQSNLKVNDTFGN